jgi:hypothetical protein
MGRGSLQKSREASPQLWSDSDKVFRKLFYAVSLFEKRGSGFRKSFVHSIKGKSKTADLFIAVDSFIERKSAGSQV